MQHALNLLILILAVLCVAEASVGGTRKLDRKQLRYAYPPSLAESRKTRSGMPWNIVYIGTPPPQEVQDVVRYTSDILRSIFVFNWTITAQLSFSNLGLSAQGFIILGQARPWTWVTVTTNETGPVNYPIALASSILGQDALPSVPEHADIVGQFNLDAPFYYATDGSAPPDGTYDFATVLLHEFIHGLGFSGNFFCSTSCDNPLVVTSLGSSWAPPNAFDRNIHGIDGQNAVTIFKSAGGTGLGDYYMAQDNMYFSLPDGSGNATLFSPHPFISGTSLYHLSDVHGGANSLMHFMLFPGDVIQMPGIIVLRMMQAVGWQIQPAAVNEAALLSSSATVVPSFLLLLSALLALELYFLYLA